MSFIDTLRKKVENSANKAKDSISLIIVSTEESTRRMTICESCPNLTVVTQQCSVCGCFMKAKTKLNSANCPVGKW